MPNLLGSFICPSGGFYIQWPLFWNHFNAQCLSSSDLNLISTASGLGLETTHVTHGLDLDLRRTYRISKTLPVNPALTSSIQRPVENGMVKGELRMKWFRSEILTDL